ncbi:hypothetical protein M2451_002852 [Dysgonomonas sp. PFB1-18]|uniref:DUF4595 domain-containing protein n=1 Tax=unclassified Dysgonomonas TaxID=2630389 RepID=UPI0024767727|nr:MULTISPECIES: DUF4595 domain-containing protein [unclassified Dysgonomonas]MDH6309961.1 hypothetical protein [Dysgonomonas sp. PF1-14]MDH6339871.1 hypothetical protein [Dysgonomonas sp. PF1-16]MDH6381519.1 hypothetical protein [Dysgonomonas sp. PFB1-18]MDH6398845.1 hypothetical protein [Dysgonomonas sp. PF1-23]
MKTKQLLFLLTFIFAGLFLSSCSSDDDDNNNNNGYNFGAKKVFTGDLPKKVGESTLKYNSDGLLEEISNTYEKVTFEYPAKTKSTGGDNIVIMNFQDLMHPEEGFVIRLKIGANGFASEAQQTFAEDSTIDTWEFGYNGDGQLNHVKRKESGNNDSETTTMTYKDGNLTYVKMTEDNSYYYNTSAIIYTSEAHPQGIENKGCIMLFDTLMGMDIDEMEYAYYAGLLGKATKNLPLKLAEEWEGDPEYDVYIYDWTLNAKGYPTSMKFDEWGTIVRLNFSW